MKSMIIKERMKDTNVDLKYCDIQANDVSQICALSTHNTQALDLHGNQITYKGLLHFSRAKWNNLTNLFLYGNFIGNKGCIYLSRTSLPAFRHLDLSDNQIGSPGINSLAKAYWPRIEYISLNTNMLTNESIKWLVRANWLSLKLIKLSFNLLTLEQLLILLLLAGKKVLIIELWDILSVKKEQKKLVQKFQMKSQLLRLGF